MMVTTRNDNRKKAIAMFVAILASASLLSVGISAANNTNNNATNSSSSSNSVGGGGSGIGSYYAYGAPLEKETGPLNVTGSQIGMNLTADAEDIDITVDPTDEITSPNGTESISTAGATDIDINSFPPAGITVVIGNETIYVTQNPVTISQPGVQQQAAQQAVQQTATPNAIRDSLNIEGGGGSGSNNTGSSNSGSSN